MTFKPIIAGLALLLAFSIVGNAQTKVIAHRGNSVVGPENTLCAFEMAIIAKADYIELDVHRTTDDSLVVIHDATIDRTACDNAKGEVNKMRFSELREKSFGYCGLFKDQYKEEKIPTLREVLTLAKGKIKVCIELKAEGISDQVLSLVEEMKMQTEVILFTFKLNEIVKIRETNSSIPVLLLIDPATSETIEIAKKNGINAIGAGGKTQLNKEFLDAAHAAGVEIWIWTINSKDTMEILIGEGVDGIITNCPSLAVNLISLGVSSPLLAAIFFL